MGKEVLAIAKLDGLDGDVVDEVAVSAPQRATVVIEDAEASGDWAREQTSRARALRHRLAMLLTMIEARTGAQVIGLIGDPRRLDLSRFDSVLRPRPRTPLPGGLSI